LTGSIGLTVYSSEFSPLDPASTLALYIWRVVPTFGGWAALAPITGISPNQQLVLPDIGGGWGLRCFLLKSIDTGSAYLGIAELP